MSTITPIQAAALTDSIHLLKQNQSAIESIIRKPLFSEEYTLLNAHFGGSVINTKDSNSWHWINSALAG